MPRALTITAVRNLTNGGLTAIVWSEPGRLSMVSWVFLHGAGYKAEEGIGAVGLTAPLARNDRSCHGARRTPLRCAQRPRSRGCALPALGGVRGERASAISAGVAGVAGVAGEVGGLGACSGAGGCASRTSAGSC